MAFVIPEAVVEVPEATAAASGLLAWLGRFGALSGAQSLLGLLFGRGNSEPATGNAMRPVVDLLAYPQRAIFTMLYYVNTDLDKIAQALYRARNYIGRVVANEAVARHYAVARVQDYLQHLIANEAVTRHYAVQRVQDYLQRLIANEAVTRHFAVQNAELYSLQLSIGVREHADRIVANEAVDRHFAVQAAETQAEQHADRVVANEAVARHNAVQTSQDTITGAVVQPIHATWPQQLLEVDSAIAAAGSDMPDLVSLLKAVPRNAPATLTEAAADPMTITRALTRAMSDCVIPNCRNLSKFGKDLSGLGTLLGAGGLLAFLVYAVKHPTEAARDTENVAGGLIDGTVTAVKDLLGV